MMPLAPQMTTLDAAIIAVLVAVCFICNSDVDILNILTSEGRVIRLCNKCRKALEDPKVQEALHKG